MSTVEEEGMRLRKEHRLRRIEVLIALLVFLTGLIYALIAWLQWGTSKRQLESQRTLQDRADRPWMVVTDVKLHNLKGSFTDQIEATVSLKNTGHTPAQECIGWISVMVIENAPCPAPDWSSDLKFDSRGVVAPGEKITFRGVTNERELDAEFVESVNKRMIRVFVRGMLRYRVFNGIGETSFVDYFEPTDKRFVPYDKGNYAK